MNKTFCLVFNNNLETPLTDKNFNFPGCLFFYKAASFQIHTLGIAAEKGAAWDAKLGWKTASS